MQPEAAVNLQSTIKNTGDTQTTTKWFKENLSDI